jgi:uncharacterized protein YdaU (DUF1376 family)
MALQWFPMYHGDYLRDTVDLSPSEHGIYLLLLMNFFQRGPLQDDLNRLCRIAANGQPEEVRTILERYWVRTDAGWINERMAEERAKSLELQEKRAEIGRRGGEASAQARAQPIASPIASPNASPNAQPIASPNGQPNGQAKVKQLVNTTTTTTTSTSTARFTGGKYIQASTPKIWARPEGVSEETWVDFLHVRKAKKAVNNATSWKMFQTQLAKVIEQTGESAEDVVARSAGNSWKTVYPPSSNGNSNGRSSQSVEEKLSEFLAADETQGRTIDGAYHVEK